MQGTRPQVAGRGPVASTPAPHPQDTPDEAWHHGAVTERERHTMLTVLDELMGPDVASTLVRHLPPAGWADVATKHDLAQLEDRLTDRFDAMLTRQMSDLRAELHGQLHAEIGSLRTELHGEIGSVRSDMQAMTRTYILGDVGLVFTVAAIAFGAARLV